MKIQTLKIKRLFSEKQGKTFFQVENGITMSNRIFNSPSNMCSIFQLWYFYSFISIRALLDTYVNGFNIGHLSLVQYLVSMLTTIFCMFAWSSSNCSIFDQNITPLISAACHGLPIVKFLVENGARISSSSCIPKRRSSNH